MMKFKLRAGMKPSSLTVFGFTGDLTKRKLLPALYRLESINELPESFQIIGVTRREIDIAEVKTRSRNT